MKKTIFDPEARASLLARMERIPPDRAPAWGKMSAPQMLCHVSDALRSALGDLPVRSKGKKLFTHPVMRWLLIYVLPWPKGAPTAPELLTTGPAEWRADLAAFRELAERMAARDPGGAWPAHPLFGALSGKAWGDLTYRHLDHHLRQFGG
ncbi:MAG TPA: DUF1569 domain-containing protein [Longimicrobium sp.]|jgi:hypothetical protein